MKIRSVQKEDLQQIYDWFRARRWPEHTFAILPSTGFVAEHDNFLIAAAWCYLDAEKLIAFQAFPVSNPAAKASWVAASLRMITSETHRHASREGAQFIFAVSHGGLAKMYESSGFTAVEKNTNFYAKSGGK